MTISVHQHGAHDCTCVNCGYTEIVTTGMRCGSRICPVCGTRLRASDTGEFRDERITHCGGNPTRRR